LYFCGYRFGSKVSMKNLGRAETGSYPGTIPNILHMALNSKSKDLIMMPSPASSGKLAVSLASTFTDSSGFAQLSKHGN